MATLNANKWFVNYESLDSDQKKIVNGSLFENGSNIGFVSGPAGSGKTIILVNALAKANNSRVAFVSYTRSLLNLADQGLPDGVNSMTYFTAQRERSNYDLIVIDEVQDVPIDALNRIIEKSKKIIIAGDVFQTIYNTGSDLNVLESLCKGNKTNLSKSYRLTSRAFAAASKINPGALEGVASSGKNTPIELYITEIQNEGDFLCYEQAKKQAALNRTCSILLPNRDKIIDFANQILKRQNKEVWDYKENRYKEPDFDSLNSHLRANKVNLQVVQNNYGDLNNAFSHNEVVLQTYHSAKGLDYQYVFLPNLSVEEATSVKFQKALFYVAITRASEALIITQKKNSISSYVRKIEEFCTLIDQNRNNDETEF